MNIDVSKIDLKSGEVVYTTNQTSDGKFIQLIDGLWWNTSNIDQVSENLVKIWMKHKNVYLIVMHTVE